MDFILNITSSFWFHAVLKLLLGFLLSGIIGLERSSRNKPAGFRTHSLVGISAVLIMLCREYMSREYNVDPTRIPAQLLSGIGGTLIIHGQYNKQTSNKNELMRAISSLEEVNDLLVKHE